MDRIYIDALSGRLRTALKQDGELTEIIYESGEAFAPGNIYAGRVSEVLKGQFVFIDIGDEKNAFLQPDPSKEPLLYDEKGRLCIKAGDCIPVQIIKSAVDEKGAAVTSRLNFTGKYCVVIANDSGIGISKKITDSQKRSELKALAEELLPDGFAVIMRTDCGTADVNTVSGELKGLVERAISVTEKAAYIKPPALIYEELSEASRIVRDLAVGKDTEVITNSADTAEKIKRETGIESITLYDGAVPLFHSAGIESGIEKALSRRVWLKNGGYLVIDCTEAMNVIDVNSGKHSGKNIKDFALKVNLEAAEEAAKQIRLRNLTGMIIIDFIDMNGSEDKQRVLQRLKECIKHDRISTTVVGMTSLGLMQLTRKKTRPPLHKILMRPCPACAGSGLAENEFYVADKVINELISVFSQTIYKKIKVKGSKRVISVLKEDKAQLKLIEDSFAACIELEEIPTGRLGYYELEKSR